MKRDWMFYYHHKVPGADKRVSFEFIPKAIWLLMALMIFMSFC